MGWGGKRPGAGRKRKSEQVNKKPARVLEHPLASRRVVETLPGVGVVTIPATLTETQAAIWAEQAPHALANGTLTPASVRAFARYCKAVAIEDLLVDGDTDHRGIMKQIDAFELRFMLTPDGKPVAKAEPAETQSKLSRFR